ncbi:FGGY family carbohydrate kinase [Actinotalea sp. M2MS4P-6]|uniref:xylulokinase n=1 Tax=Actinotalea sp. M2MS4P-6 TaxID=2983762 RepID=UPI0021E38C55|nr:FGGY family carbohydrate kinase [Actinotalea sp. M2MS4P-6]MCV2395653.1 FGGY family carbohydrate kinase [Actinotalea sp. M2MS4P-6]
MPKYLVGIDEGTTGCKTCVFDVDGNVLGQDYREYPCHYPRPGWVEQVPEEITPALFASCKAAVERSGVDPADIVALALATQGAVIGLLDEDGELIRPFVGWQDLRGEESVDQITDRIPVPEYYAITGDPLGFVFSTTKLAWLREHEPENWARTALFSTHMDYFMRQFGAQEYWTDISSASREGMFDVDNHEWSQRVHDVLGIPLSKRAKIALEPGKVVGTLPAHVAAQTGLAEGTLLCIGAHDQNASTFGAGAVRDGTAVMVVGTFGSCFVVTDKPVRDPDGKLVVKGNHGVGNWTIEGFSNASASSFRWYRDVFGDLESAAARTVGVDPYELICAEAEHAEPGAGGVTFLPYLQGAAGARLNADARGCFVGMSLGTTKAQMARAVLEGITFEMRDVLEAEAKAGITVETIRLTGGAAKSPFWCQLMADVFGKPIELLQTTETGCLGAALYAGIGAGIYAGPHDAVDRAVTTTAVYHPDPSRAAVYDEAFGRFVRIYEALDGTVFGAS